MSLYPTPQHSTIGYECASPEEVIQPLIFMYCLQGGASSMTWQLQAKHYSVMLVLDSC